MNSRRRARHAVLAAAGSALILACCLAPDADAAPRTVLGELFSSAG